MNSDNILKTTNGGEPIGITPEQIQIRVIILLYQNYPNPFNAKTRRILYEIENHRYNRVYYEKLKGYNDVTVFVYNGKK
jgi:hypothetical protein